MNVARIGAIVSVALVGLSLLAAVQAQAFRPQGSPDEVCSDNQLVGAGIKGAGGVGWAQCRIPAGDLLGDEWHLELTVEGTGLVSGKAWGGADADCGPVVMAPQVGLGRCHAVDHFDARNAAADVVCDGFLDTFDTAAVDLTVKCQLWAR